MAMKRGLSVCERSSDEQRHINEDFEREADIDHTIPLELWEKLITKLASPFIPKEHEIMVDDDHYSTIEDPGAMDTKKNPRKVREGPLDDADWNEHVILVCKMSLRRREPNEALSSVSRIVDHVNYISRKSSVFFCDRGHSSFIIIEALQANDVAVFVTANDFETQVYSHRSFQFRENNIAETTIVKHDVENQEYNNENDNRTDRMRRKYLSVSGRAYPLQISSEAKKEQLVSVGRRKGGTDSTGVTILYT